MENNTEINIAHLYPEILNIYGDDGNICALTNRLKWRNISVNVDKISLNDDINYDKYDIYFIGGGQNQNQDVVSPKLMQHKEAFKNLADKGVVMLAVCGGYQLFGNYYGTKESNKIDGIGLLDVFTIDGDERLTGNVTVETDFLKNNNTLVGFESHTGWTFLGDNTKPLGKVLTGYGNNFTDKTEGARYNNVFGTYLHGSLLPKNPEFCDFLLELALKNKLQDNAYSLEALDDALEADLHDSLIQKAY